MINKIVPIREPCSVPRNGCITYINFPGVCKGRVRMDNGMKWHSHECVFNNGKLVDRGIANINNLTAEERYLDISTRAKEDKIYGMSSTETIS